MFGFIAKQIVFTVYSMGSDLVTEIGNEVEKFLRGHLTKGFNILSLEALEMNTCNTKPKFYYFD